jgi:hypothetical protein
MEKKKVFLRLGIALLLFAQARFISPIRTG